MVHGEGLALRIMRPSHTIHYDFKKETQCIVATREQIVQGIAEREIISDFIASCLNHSSLSADKPHSFKRIFLERTVSKRLEAESVLLNSLVNLNQVHIFVHSRDYIRHIETISSQGPIQGSKSSARLQLAFLCIEVYLFDLIKLAVVNMNVYPFVC